MLPCQEQAVTSITSQWISPTAAGVIQPLLRTGLEICTESKGFLSINLADQTNGKSSGSGPKGFSTWPYWCSQLAEAVHAAPSSTHLHRLRMLLNQYFPSISKSDKNQLLFCVDESAWCWRSLLAPQTTAWKHGPSCPHPYKSFFA